MKYYRLYLFGICMFLSACGDDVVDSNKALVPLEQSWLAAFMDRQKICDMVSTQEVQNILQLTSQVKAKSKSFGSFYNCKYSWQGKRYGGFNLGLSVYNKAELFPPKKLSEKELNNSINESINQLKKIKPDLSKSILDLTKKSIISEETSANQFEELTGIGDAAILITTKEESILTAVVGNIKLTITMGNPYQSANKNPPRGESIKQIAKYILKEK